VHDSESFSSSYLESSLSFNEPFLKFFHPFSYIHLRSVVLQAAAVRGSFQRGGRLSNGVEVSGIRIRNSTRAGGRVTVS
jgi:hypothetical protein